MQITSRPISDDMTICKHVRTDENAFIVFNSFSYTKKHVILAITCNIVIAQIALSIKSSPSGDEMGKIWRTVKGKNITSVD